MRAALLEPTAAVLPTVHAAQSVEIVAGSGERLRALAFDDGSSEAGQLALWVASVPTDYADQPATLRLAWDAELADGGAVRWSVGLRSLETSIALSAAHAYAFDAAAATVTTTPAAPTYSSVALASAALTAGVALVVIVRRDSGHAADTLAGRARLLMAELLW